MIQAILIAAASVPASAAPFYEPAPVARKVVADFARCVVRLKPDAAARVVIEADLPLHAVADEKLFNRSCMPNNGTLRAAGPQMRFALADALVQSELAKLDTNFATAAPLVHRDFIDRPMPPEVAANPKRVEAWNAFAARATGYALLSPFGECVVRAAPAESQALLLTKVESAEESVAVAALSPKLGKCVRKGEQLVLNKYNLRGSVALNFYRLAMAPRVVGGER